MYHRQATMWMTKTRVTDADRMLTASMLHFIITITIVTIIVIIIIVIVVVVVVVVI